jgi:cytochrome c peroxidase
MHNGMLKTLKQVIEFYNDPAKIIPNAINRDSLLAKPLGLTDQEKIDLESFLIALTDKSFDASKK